MTLMTVYGFAEKCPKRVLRRPILISYSPYDGPPQPQKLSEKSSSLLPTGRCRRGQPDARIAPSQCLNPDKNASAVYPSTALKSLFNSRLRPGAKKKRATYHNVRIAGFCAEQGPRGIEARGSFSRIPGRPAGLLPLRCQRRREIGIGLSARAPQLFHHARQGPSAEE